MTLFAWMVSSVCICSKLCNTSLRKGGIHRANVMCSTLVELAQWHQPLFKPDTNVSHMRHMCGWLLHTWHCSDETECFSSNRLLPQLVSAAAVDGWNKRQAGRWRSRGAGLRCEQVWVHCRAGMGTVPGAQLRGGAHVHMCVYIYIYIYTPGLCWNTESLERRERRAGRGFSVNLISHCRNFERGRLRSNSVCVWRVGGR